MNLWGIGRTAVRGRSPVEGRAVSRHQRRYRGALPPLRARALPRASITFVRSRRLTAGCLSIGKSEEVLTPPQLSLSNSLRACETVGGCTKLQIGISV